MLIHRYKIPLRKNCTISFLIISLFSVFYFFSCSKSEKNFDEISDEIKISEEVISPIGTEYAKKENIGLEHRTQRLLKGIVMLFDNWKILFDYVSYNKNYGDAINIEELSKQDLVSKIKTGKYKFNPGDINSLIDVYGEIIKQQCNHYKIDWRLIFALIRQESYFNPEAISRAGAYGFMQIMPKTGLGLQNELDLEDTKAPVNNLIAGIYYYATLVSSFDFIGDDKYKFALASYNAGIARVIDVMTITYFYGKDYKKWDEVKEYLPFLSNKYDSVHALVWPLYKKPPGGILNNWQEPYNYVELVSFYYDNYKKYIPSNLQEEKEHAKKKKRKKS